MGKHGLQVVSSERLRRCAPVTVGGAGGVAAPIEVLGDDCSSGLRRLLEPRAGELVPERPVAFGQRRIGPLAEERMPERELLLAREAALAAPHQDLAFDEGRELVRDLAPARLSAQERGDAPHPE
ncbi:hypothetical protein [Sorangium atrum]|uniref:Uncharacterized protein n=1 Tax=Sorangium atrum TaxID=2995308 RepID=A0ABT5C570_9BACT|nr:hypothetical protein [Sorangium aterium]MDC0681564.1 hypothetical protein [Sorangium aterium]